MCGDAVLHVLVHEGDVLAVVAAPEEVWVSGNPTFGEGDQFGIVLGGFLDELDGLFHGLVLVEPTGLGLDGGCFVLAD